MEKKTVDIGGPVFYLDFSGAAKGPTFVLLHGLGGSHANWLPVAPALARRGRVLVPDLPGFGLSPLAGRRASLSSCRATLVRFLADVAEQPVILVGNSMGGLLAMRQAVVDPDSVAGLVLIAPALPRDGKHVFDKTAVGFLGAAMIPRVGESVIANGVRAYGAKRMVERMMRLCMVDPADVDGDVFAAHVAVAEASANDPGATSAFLQAARSLVRVLVRPRRVRRLITEISAPTLLIAGHADRLVPRASVEALARIRPDWELVLLDDCGHTPMLEDARSVASAIDAWLSGPASWALIGEQSLAGRARAV